MHSGLGLQVALFERRTLILESVAQALTYAGFDVVVQDSDLGHFLNQLEALRPAIAIVDVSDVQRGIKALQLARQRSASTRLVALVTQLSAQELRATIEAGVSGVFSTTSDHLSTLTNALVRVASGERLFPAAAMDFSLESPVRNESRRNHVSTRELQVLSCIAAGFDNLKIAASLGICERTVKAHVSALYRKLGSENRTQLALEGLSQGLSPPVQ